MPDCSWFRKNSDYCRFPEFLRIQLRLGAAFSRSFLSGETTTPGPDCG